MKPSLNIILLVILNKVTIIFNASRKLALMVSSVAYKLPLIIRNDFESLFSNRIPYARPSRRLAFANNAITLPNLNLRKRTVIRISSVAGGLAVGITVFSLILNAQVIGVSVDGKIVGYVENEAQYAELIEGLKESVSKENGDTEIIIEDSQVALSSSFKPSDDVISIDENALKETLINNDIIKAKGYTIVKNGEPLVSVGTEVAAEEILQKVEATYGGTDPSVAGKFIDTLEIQSAEKGIGEILSVDSAVEYILTGGVAQDIYTVEDGDSVWGICNQFQISQEDLFAANPELADGKIFCGDQVKLNKLAPMVNYQTYGVVTTIEPIPYPVTEVPTDELAKGERVVEVAGVEGQRRISKEVTSVNGVTVDSKELTSIVISEPVAGVVKVGTKVKATNSAFEGGTGNRYVGGSGKLGRPMASLQTSSSWGDGRNHKGIDFRNPTGTPIYAAEGGTVSTAGWTGGYGYLVIVKHGGGIETYYAHCSSLNVKVGQTVSKGQQVARVGSTGNSTGPHLHFEVRVNGTPVNPIGWL